MDGMPTPTLPLSLAISGVAGSPGGSGLGGPHARDQVVLARELGFRAVQLNAMDPTMRPRELGRSARRDLASLIRANELEVSGVDLFLPPDHLIDPAHADRAMAAMLATIEFAAEVAELAGGDAIVSAKLPRSEDSSAAIATIEESALGEGVRVADHAWPPEPRDDRSPIGIGIDPAIALMAGGDPASAVSRAGDRLVSARLSDASSTSRVAPGAGELDEFGYAVAVATSGYAGWVPVDVRGLADGAAIAREALSRHRSGRDGGPGGAVQF